MASMNLAIFLNGSQSFLSSNGMIPLSLLSRARTAATEGVRWKQGVPKPWDTGRRRVKGRRWRASSLVEAMASTAVSAAGRMPSHALTGRWSSSRHG